MRSSAALTLLGRPDPVPGAHRPIRRVGGSRGVPERVIQDVGDALAPCAEGVAFAMDVIAGVERIVLAAAQGSRQAVVNEAGRLGHRAMAERAEFQRLARAIEDPDGGRAA